MKTKQKTRETWELQMSKRLNLFQTRKEMIRELSAFDKCERWDRMIKVYLEHLCQERQMQ